MLVLSRKIGEKILIGDNVEITLVRVNGKNAQIGITAPPEIPVKRSEIIGTPDNGSTPTPSTQQVPAA